MTRHRRTLILAAACVCLTIAGGIALAQPGMWRGQRGTPGVIPEDRAGIPNWSNDEKYKKDVFTFCRVQYESAYGGGRRGFGGGGGGFGGGRFSGMLQPGGFGGGGRRGGGGGWNGGWLTDFPDSDLNFSFRLQQLTSIKVNPVPVTRRVTDPDLSDFPFLYMIEPGRLLFSEEEVKAFRKYLLNGGFLMVDDFWGDIQYASFYQQIKRVFPEREPQELGLDHEIFHNVYKLKEKPQVPSIHSWEGPGSEVTWESEMRHGGGTRDVHYRGIFDDKGRMMVLICHNTDLGDGWEREGENIDYFHEFSEKRSYPMGINIVTYAMTH